MKIIWQDYPMEDVMNFFTKSFQLKPTESVERAEWFYDPAKKRVIFRLFISEKHDAPD